MRIIYGFSMEILVKYANDASVVRIFVPDAARRNLS